MIRPPFEPASDAMVIFTGKMVGCLLLCAMLWMIYCLIKLLVFMIQDVKNGMIKKSTIRKRMYDNLKVFSRALPKSLPEHHIVLILELVVIFVSKSLLGEKI